MSAQEKIDDLKFQLLAELAENAVPDLVTLCTLARDFQLLLCMLHFCSILSSQARVTH